MVWCAVGIPVKFIAKFVAAFLGCSDRTRRPVQFVREVNKPSIAGSYDSECRRELGSESVQCDSCALIRHGCRGFYIVAVF